MATFGTHLSSLGTTPVDVLCIRKRHLNAGAAAAVALAVLACALVFTANGDDGLTERVSPLDHDNRLAGYRLDWSDEFGGDRLNTGEWHYRTDSKHWSTQRPENVAVSGGYLQLNLVKEKAGDKDYTGAGVITKKTFRYGYYEARFKCPPGKGWHSSFWMQKYDGQGGTGAKLAQQELDACEQDSLDPNSYSVNVHQWNPKHRMMGGKRVKTPNLSEEFHVWGCQFTPKAVHYYFDGKLVASTDVSSFEHNDQNIWLTSIASRLGPTDSVDDGKLPAQFVCDWVRFYRAPDDGEAK
jgi:beta-glucanase (GH16 family)